MPLIYFPFVNFFILLLLFFSYRAIRERASEGVKKGLLTRKHVSCAYIYESSTVTPVPFCVIKFHFPAFSHVQRALFLLHLPLKFNFVPCLYWIQGVDMLMSMLEKKKLSSPCRMRRQKASISRRVPYISISDNRTCVCTQLPFNILCINE
jgi:hypothetical protein